MVIGIKYMMGSLEERASYKKSMLPYVIGAIMLFAAVNLTAFIYNTFALDEAYLDPGKAATAAQLYIQSHTADEVYLEMQEAGKRKNEATKESEIQYWKNYENELYKSLQFTYL